MQKNVKKVPKTGVFLLRTGVFLLKNTKKYEKIRVFLLPILPNRYSPTHRTAFPTPKPTFICENPWNTWLKSVKSGVKYLSNFFLYSVQRCVKSQLCR